MGNNNSRRHSYPPSVRMIPREPLQEQIDLPETESWYPPVRPPTTPKKDIYHPQENRDIYLHSLKAPKDIENSWDDLVHYLTAIYRTDMMKVRSIFSWLGVQDVENESFTFVSTPSDIDEITPRGYKKLIKERKGSYASLFAILCRKAGIPCAIINGISKGNAYEVGMKEVSHLRDRWNAVYISGWRLVHPLWAFKAIISYKNGSWVPSSSSQGLEIRDFEDKWFDCVQHDFNEYFFIVEPVELVSVCLPDNQKWQLCSPTMTLDKWIAIPHFMKRYYMEGFKIPSEFACTLKAKDGVCALVVKCPENQKVDYQLAYDFYFNLTSSKLEVEEPIFLSRCVLMSKDDKSGKWSFEMRLPVSGMYRLTVYGGPSTKRSLPWIFDVAIACEEPAESMTPYPATPAIGYGPVSMTKKAGLLVPSHSGGMLFVKPRQPFHITFSLEQHLYAKARLTGAGKRNFDNCVSVSVNNQSTLHILAVSVEIPSEGEYALMIATRPKEGKATKFENVCNYYISTDPPRENGTTVQNKHYRTAFEVNTRKNLEDVIKGKDLTQLQTAVQKFKEGGFQEVDGALEKATAKLEYLELAKALKDAINRLKLDMLNTAIENAEQSPHTKKLLSLLEQAREERDKLLKMNKFLHDVLEMKQATLTEMVSYQKPITVINDVLKATLLLLGERREKLEKWEDIKTCMRKTGKDGVLRRIQAFEVASVSNATLRRVQKIIFPYDEDTVRGASAAAATFFLWIKSIVDGSDSEV